MSLSPRMAVLLAVVALPLGAAAASYALAEDTVPDVPAQVRIGAVTGQVDPTGVDPTGVSPPAPTTTAATGSVVSTPRPRVVPQAPPVDRDDDDGGDGDGDDDGGDDDD